MIISSDNKAVVPCLFLKIILYCLHVEPKEDGRDAIPNNVSDSVGKLCFIVNLTSLHLVMQTQLKM